jgi:hypothetical protein
VKWWCPILGSTPALPKLPCSLPLTSCMFVWSADWSELSVAILPPLYRPDITTAWIPWTSLCPMMTLLSPLPLGLSCKARYVQNTHPGPCEPHPLWTGNGTLAATVQAVFNINFRMYLRCKVLNDCIFYQPLSYFSVVLGFPMCIVVSCKMDIWFRSSHAVLFNLIIHYSLACRLWNWLKQSVEFITVHEATVVKSVNYQRSVDLSNFGRWQFWTSVVINLEYNLASGNVTYQVPITPRWWCFGRQS